MKTNLKLNVKYSASNVDPIKASGFSKSGDVSGTASEQSNNSDRIELNPLSEEADTLISKKRSLIYDEYADHDTSDEEDIRNTVGNIPMEWYHNHLHLGYTISGEKINAPKLKGKIGDFLERIDNPNYWRTVYNKKTGEETVLSKEILDIIDKARSGIVPELNIPWRDASNDTVLEMPLSGRMPSKKSFLPSESEERIINRLAHAIRTGLVQPKPPRKLPGEVDFFDLWKEDSTLRKSRAHIPAPKLNLPRHGESYNPSPEYLFTDNEAKQWEEQEAHRKKQDYIPVKYDKLRHVPAYSRSMRDRFERCLDLYLCPRQVKHRPNIDPDELLPKLPKPQDLRPFPTFPAVVYRGHKGIVRGVSIDHTGQWVASCADDKAVLIWELSTGRCVRNLHFADAVNNVEWCPSPQVNILLISSDCSVILANPAVGDSVVVSHTNRLLKALTPTGDSSKHATWQPITDIAHCWFSIVLPKQINSISWHPKGDYFVSTSPNAASTSIFVHQMTKMRSQQPFQRNRGLVQKAIFHPTKPLLFVLTQVYIRIFNLAKQEMVKKLFCGTRWASDLAIHPGGDHIVISTYDCRIIWFDLDLSNKPYTTLRHHKRAVRSVCFHNSFPLFAAGSDDGTITISHGMVYNDLMQNPLIVPVKILDGHNVVNDMGSTCLAFHPVHPWIISGGGDSILKLFTD